MRPRARGCGGLVLVGVALVAFYGCDEPRTTYRARPEGPATAAVPEPDNPPMPEAEPEPEAWSDAWLAREGERYLTDGPYRRESMLAALRNHENLYSRIRIASYGLGDRGWDRLPDWNPRSRTLTRDDRRRLEAGETLSASNDSPLFDGVAPHSREAWVALGREVFFRFPLRADRWVEFGLRDEARAERFGIQTAADGSAPGVVLFRDLDGRDRVGITCAVCHTTRIGDELVEGRARRGFDYGALQLAHAEARGTVLDDEMARRMASWGPGRADITEDDDEDPVAIPDLYGLRHQSALTQAGTIRHIGPIAVALRQETQYLYANHHRARPSRVLMWALTMYLYSLEPPPRPAPTSRASDVEAGRALFDAECADCHHNEVYGGDPVRASRVGTDPGLSRGVARGTGLYRPSSLLRVADAAPYLHHGAVATLDDLFSRDRLSPAYEGPLGAGPVPGHEYGLDLTDDERRALFALLRTL